MSSQAEPLAAPTPGEPTVRRDVTTRAYRTLGAIAVLTAIAYQLQKGLARQGITTTDYFSYFTELSNLIAAGVFLYGALSPRRARSRAVELWRGAAVVYILTTAIVYAVLLSGHIPVYPWVNTVLHRVIPIAVALDWLLDPPRVRLRLRDTLVWLVFPALYVAYTLIRGAIVDWYPYFFVNPHRHGGYLLVAGDCLAISMGIVALIVATTWVGNRRAG
jgi:hypothetical protein